MFHQSSKPISDNAYQSPFKQLVEPADYVYASISDNTSALTDQVKPRRGGSFPDEDQRQYGIKRYKTNNFGESPLTASKARNGSSVLSSSAN